VVVVAVVVVRTRRPAPSRIAVPSEKLKEFVELYDGRNALRLELDRMAQDLARGALNKHEYRRRRRTIELRMSELDRALQPLRQDLKAFHPRYNEIFLRMERAEGEIDANRLGEEHFKTQYRSGKISKEAYDRAIEDLYRRIEKAREVIDTSLVTLREEAR
jgi:chromosome segregation ATPase